MIIEDVREYENTTSFENLLVGDVFESDCDFYLKTSDSYDERFNAFNLTSNEPEFMDSDEQVIQVKATIEISNY